MYLSRHLIGCQREERADSREQRGNLERMSQVGYLLGHVLARYPSPFFRRLLQGSKVRKIYLDDSSASGSRGLQLPDYLIIRTLGSNFFRFNLGIMCNS